MDIGSNFKNLFNLKVNTGILDLDINGIMKEGGLSKKKKILTVELYNGSEFIPILSTATIESYSDFLNNVTDHILVYVSTDIDSFKNKLQSHTDNLTVRIKTDYCEYLNDTYKAKIVNVDVLNKTIMTEEKRKENGDIVLIVQCIRIKYLELRRKYVSGVHNKTNLENVLNYEILNGINDTEKIENISLLARINNLKTYKSVIIKTGTRLLSLPKYLHDKYGLYNGGIGTYLYRNTFYTYPVYKNTDEYNSRLSLEIIITNKQYIGSIDIVHKLEGNKLKILVNKVVSMNGTDDSKTVDNGSGIIRPSLGNLIDKDIILHEGKALVDSRNNIVYKQNNNEDSPYIYDTVSNIFQNKSTISKNNSKIYQFKWNNSVIDLLHPGMSVVVLLLDNDGKIVKENGILLKVDTVINNMYKNIISMLTVAVSKN